MRISHPLPLLRHLLQTINLQQFSRRSKECIRDNHLRPPPALRRCRTVSIFKASCVGCSVGELVKCRVNCATMRNTHDADYHDAETQRCTNHTNASAKLDQYQNNVNRENAHYYNTTTASTIRASVTNLVTVREAVVVDVGKKSLSRSAMVSDIMNSIIEVIRQNSTSVSSRNKMIKAEDRMLLFQRT